MRTRIALVSALLLASCAGPRPPMPESASVTAPPDWRAGGGASMPIRADWWEGFGDPILSSLVVDALDHNVDLLVAAARIDEAGAQFRLVASQSKLSIGLGAQGGHDRSLNAFGVGFDATDGKALVTASYELDLFGRLAASTRAAKSDLLATRAARDTLRLAIASEVIQGYIGLRSLDEKLAIAQDTLATRDQERRLIQHRVAAGYSSALEAQQAEAEYQVAAQLVPEIQLAITRQENALNLLGGNSPGPIRRGKPLSDLGSAPIPSALPAEVLRQRPDIAEAEDRIAAADHQLDAARAAFMPRIQLVASGGLVDSTVLANPVSLFSLGGSILAPLFEGGALRAQEAATASRRDQAAFAYRKAALTAFAEVAMRRDREARQLDLSYHTSSLTLSGTSAAKLQPGDRAPDAPCRGQAGQPTRLFALFQGAQWTLLGSGVETRPTPRAGVRIAMVGEHQDIVDDGGYIAEAYGLATDEWILIRPDGYIAAILPTNAMEARLTHYLEGVLPGWFANADQET